jgi:membrane protein YqaA with SNARE-associated domain
LYNKTLYQLEARLKALFSTLTSWGPVGLFLLSIVDSGGLPLPGGIDALVVLLAVANPGTAYWSALLAVLGSLIGNYILYAIARKGGRAYLDAHATSRRAMKIREWFVRYGLLTVFIPTLLPIPLPMKPFVLSAGALGVGPAAFIGVVAIGRLLRYTGLAYLGAQLGVHSMKYLKEHAWHLSGFAAALFVALYLMVRAVERRRLSSAT